MAEELWTVRRILEWCEGYLERHGDENPRVSAQWLLSEALGMSRIDLYLNYAKPLSLEERDTMRSWVRRRGEGEPLQLICGKAPFRYLTLKVAPGVLIPRPETEVLVSEAFAELALPSTAAHVVEDDDGERIDDADLPAIQVLDLCTGSGCIACAIACEYPAARVIATDISPKALALAWENVDALKLEGRIELRHSDLFEQILPDSQSRFDLIISNPPYVPTQVVAGLAAEVRDYEPTLALDGGQDGLDLVRRFAHDALTCLKPDGVLALELFEGHMDEAADLLTRAGFDRVRIANDLTGAPRVVVARKPVQVN